MREAFQLIAIAGVSFAFFMTGFCVTFLAGFAVLISFAGTGGFTSDPPPTESAYLPALAVILAWLAAEILLFLSWKRLMRFIDDQAVEL